MKPKGQRIFLPVLAVFLLAGIIGLTGCMSSAGKQYYQLFLPSSMPGAAASQGNTAAPRLDKILMVEPVEIEAIYNDYRVVYRTSPYQLNYYSYHFWIKKPGKLIRDSIREYLEVKQVFPRVITGFSMGNPDLILKASVHVIEEVDRPGPWYAHLKMDIEIKDFKTGEAVLFHSFNRQKQLIMKKVSQVPVAVSKMLQEELDIVMNKLVLKTAKPL